MATAFRTAGFQSAWNLLDGNISGVTLYDYVPGEDQGSPTANKPYGVLEGGDTTPFDNDTWKGVFFDMTLHIFSDALGRSEIDAKLDAAYALLHRASPAPGVGYTAVDCLVLQTQVFVLEDGKTRHGIMRFQLTLQEA
jgi:hypothetical protein